MFHTWAPGATFWLAKGTTLYNTLADYMRGVLVPGRLCRGEDADHLQQGAVGDVRPLAALPREHVPRRVAKGRQMALKAMNCPGHFLIYASEMRSYRDLPIRYHEQTPLHRNEASGVLSRPHARPSVLAGRRALLRDGVADRRGSRAAVAAGASRLRRLRPDYTVKLSTRPDQFLGDVETWNHAEAAEARARLGLASHIRSTKGTAPSTDRRSTSTSPTRSGANGSARRSSSTSRCRSGST